MPTDEKELKKAFRRQVEHHKLQLQLERAIERNWPVEEIIDKLRGFPDEPAVVDVPLKTSDLRQIEDIYTKWRNLQSVDDEIHESGRNHLHNMRTATVEASQLDNRNALMGYTQQKVSNSCSS